MEKDYSEQALSKFMDFASNKGLINQSTAQSRKSAFLKIYSVLEQGEKKDLRDIDFEDTFARFQTRYPTAMTPESFVTYKSRAKKALEDFITWSDNPSSFKPQQPQKRGPKVSKFINKTNASEALSDSDEVLAPAISGGQILRVPIRENILVQVSNLPYDLTKAEADRICKLINAHIL